jgi:outer membrane receptor protein involved in Fe transport
LALSLAWPAFALADTARFEIRAEPLAAALRAFAQQAHMQLLYEYAIVRDVKGNPVTGVLEKHAALEELLQDTGLIAVFTSDNAATIRPRRASVPTGEAAKRSATGGDPKSRVGKKDSPAATGDAQENYGEVADTSNRRRSKQSSQANATLLQEVVVTGTLIPGVKNLASPLIQFGRTDIEESGASTVQQFMQQQAFDWGGGASEIPIGEINGGGTADNHTEGSGLNLRGLGNEATLVLIDGHRVAPGNTDANFVDTSLIPLDAVERIEVDPSGASAIYGADAVGGVVNIILRPSFQGAQTSVHYGSVTQGGSRELQMGQIAGESWASGSAVVGYQFYDRTPLLASDRTFSMDQAAPFDLLQEQVQNSAFVNLQQTINDTTDAYATGLFSHRSTDGVQTFGTLASPLFTINDGPVYTTLGDGILGTRTKVSATDVLNLSLQYSGTSTGYSSFMNKSPSEDLKTSYSLFSFNGDLTGSALTLPGGPLLFAVGGEYRREALEADDLIAGTGFQPSRSILSGYLELNIPVLGQSTEHSTGPRLSASVASRIDHYSDFGTTINPNVGVVFAPSQLWKLRATFGTSFAAPALSELNQTPFEIAALSMTDPATRGLSNALEVFGGNQSLKPETASVFTGGLDFGRTSGGLHGSLTYYHIDFRRLILTIQEAGFPLYQQLTDAGELGSSIVQRNPPLTDVDALASSPSFTDLTGIAGGVNLNSIVAVIDNRSLNLAQLKTDGIDLTLAYTKALAVGDVELGFDGTYTSKFERQVTPYTPIVSLLNTPYNQNNFKSRAKVAFGRGRWLLAAFVNYVNAYQDNRETPPIPVGSWTTLDMDLRYTIPHVDGMLKETSISLSVLNAMNRNPPFVASPNARVYPGLIFDGANANAVGRFVALQITTAY